MRGAHVTRGGTCARARHGGGRGMKEALFGAVWEAITTRDSVRELQRTQFPQ